MQKNQLLNLGNRILEGLEVKLVVQDWERMEELARELQALFPGQTTFKSRRQELVFPKHGRVDFVIISELELLAEKPVLVVLDSSIKET